jgi:segregation and condensation protein B
MTASSALADIIERLKRREETAPRQEARPPPLRAVPEPAQLLRIVEALLFAAAEPLSTGDLTAALPEGSDVPALLGELQRAYAARGVNLVQVAGRWTFRTAEDLGHLMRRDSVESRRLSRAALETLAIIAYHQPVTRAEVEAIRGVAMSRGTLDQLLEIGWVRMRGRRRSPGRPVTYGTTDSFLVHFGLNAITDLPGLQELKGAGLLDANLPPDFDIPMPSGDSELTPEEEPLEDEEPEAALEKDQPDLPLGDGDEGLQ